MIFILFGWGQRTKKLIEETYKKCKYCHNGTLDYKKITTWFTIFFIPLIPYKKEYYLMCNNCERGYESGWISLL